MNDQTASGRRPDDSTEQRQAMEGTVLAFRALAGNDPYVAERPDPAQALRDLADSGLHRVIKQRILLDGLLRTRPAERDQTIYDAARYLLGKTLPGDPDDSQVEELMALVDRVAGGDDWERLQPSHWEAFSGGASEAYGYDIEELSFSSGCNDQQQTTKYTPDGESKLSRLIEAQFWSNEPPMAFARYVNPRNWPRCSVAWREMTDLTGTSAESGDYDCVFREVVKINDRVLRVPLEVGYRERPDGSRVWARFNIDHNLYEAWNRDPDSERVPVDVDTGTVSAERRPGGPAQTLVRATKYLHMVDDDGMVPELACDAGWPDLMIAMAERCATRWPPEEPVTVTPEAGRTALVDAAIRRFVDEVAAEYQQGIGQTRPHFRRLIGRFTGASWDPRWINDLLDIGKVTADRYGAVASSVRGLADGLRNADRGGRP
jgi:hypothetical protein